MSVDLKAHRNWTIETLDEWACDQLLEIWEGELIEMPPASPFHNLVAMRLAALLLAYAENKRDLSASATDGFLLNRDPDVYYIPDAALFRIRGDMSKSWIERAPELAVEVLSPANSKPEIASKKAWYFRAGAEQVWLVDPDKKTIEIHYKAGQEQLASGPAILKCSGIVDGLEVDLAKVFDDSKYR